MHVPPPKSGDPPPNLDRATLLEAALDATGVATFLIGPGNDVLFMSSGFAALVGLPESTNEYGHGLAWVRAQARNPAVLDAALARPATEVVEFEFDLHDGRTFACVRRPLVLPTGVGRAWTVRDVTEAVADRRALAGARASQQALYDDAPVMLHSIDAQGRLLAVSRTWLDTLGYDRADVIGRRSTDFLSPASRAYAEREVLPAFFLSGTCADIAYEMLHKDGSIRRVRLTGIGERDASGNIARSLAVMVDVTEWEAAQAELERHRMHLEDQVGTRTEALSAANRELETFSYRVSHDLRAPLRHIEAFSLLLAETQSERLDPDGLALVARIRAGVARQARIIDALLGLSRVTVAPLANERVALEALARLVFAELAAAEPDRTVEVEVGPLPDTVGDPELLRILLENLLGNAWKFTRRRDSARIGVHGDRRSGESVYRVVDNGAGFDMAQVDRLFAPFERLHSQSAFEGTGVGLATAARIVARHGGRIWAVGDPERGATLFFSLPDR